MLRINDQYIIRVTHFVHTMGAGWPQIGSWRVRSRNRSDTMKKVRCEMKGKDFRYEGRYKRTNGRAICEFGRLKIERGVRIGERLTFLSGWAALRRRSGRGAE